jgi:hypothetical protein
MIKDGAGASPKSCRDSGSNLGQIFFGQDSGLDLKLCSKKTKRKSPKILYTVFNRSMGHFNRIADLRAF